MGKTEPSRDARGPIEAIRRFSRFYTRRMGVLEESLLKSEFGLTEARIIYELAFQQPVSAASLTESLGLDGGYVSRILSKLERMAMLVRTQSSADGRVKLLSLTEKGWEQFATLNEASKIQVGSMLAAVSDDEQLQLVESMNTIAQILGGEESARPFVLRPPVPGDMGWVVQRHGQLYSQEYGWNQEFEGLVAEIVSRFVRDFKPDRERCWIAEKDGQNVGSVFLVRKSQRIAQLRLLLVDPAGRGLGIGSELVHQCSTFARDAGYRKIMLWTNDILHAARRIYEREGYCLVKEENHTSFGHDLVGQIWELDL